MRLSTRCLIILSTISMNTFIHAQNVTGKKVETKFFRPALTSVYVQNSDSKASTVIEALKQLNPEMRFDNHNVKTNLISISLGKEPEIVVPANPLDLKKAKKEHAEALAKYKIIKEKAVVQSLNQTSREIVAKWYSRDENGNMSSKLIKERGQYSATDADVIKDKASEVSRLANGIGKILMKKSYVAIYEVTKVKSMDEVYNEMDASAQATAQKLNKPFTPTKRTLEGYKVEYKCLIYKLDWSDSMKSIFENNYLVTESTEGREEKIRAFNNAKIPMLSIVEVGGTISATQSNDPASYKYTKRKSMQELLQDAAPSIQEDAMFEATKLIDDFKTKAPVLQDYPTTAKIGTKEGLYLDEQFYIYEIEENPDGTQKKKKKAVARVKNIANNSIVAKGESPASTFRQVGGRRIYDGMLIEMKEDLGLAATLAYGSDGVLGALDLRVDRYLKVYKTDSSAMRFLRGVHIAGYMTMKGYNTALLADTSVASKLTGARTMIGGSIGKEFFFTKKGKMYFYPEIGGALLTYTNTMYNNVTIEDKTEDKSWSTIGLVTSFGLGMNLSPRLSFILKPSLNVKLGSFSDDVTNKEIDPTNFSKEFKDMNSTSMVLNFGLRLRF